MFFDLRDKSRFNQLRDPNFAPIYQILPGYFLWSSAFSLNSYDGAAVSHSCIVTLRKRFVITPLYFHAMPRVLSFPMWLQEEWIQWANKNDIDLVIIQPQSEQEMLDILSSHDRIDVITNTYYGALNMGGYTAKIIASAAHHGCKAICHAGAGYEKVGDVDEWSKWGVQVAHAPVSNSRATADHAVWLLFGAIRLSYPYMASLRSGNWIGSGQLGHDPRGITLGILGMGNIGRLIRDRCRAFDFKEILYHSRTKQSPDVEQDTRYEADINAFLKQCNAVVAVLPLNSQTRHILNRERIGLMPANSFLVNIGRGALIDESAMADALETGKLASVGLDVFEHEPEIHPKLLASSRALLTPHMATATWETRDDLDREVLSNVEAYFRTGRVLSQVAEQTR